MPRLTTSAERLIFPHPHLWLPTLRFSRRRCCYGGTGCQYCLDKLSPGTVYADPLGIVDIGCNQCDTYNGGSLALDVYWLEKCIWQNDFPCDAGSLNYSAALLSMGGRLILTFHVAPAYGHMGGPFWFVDLGVDTDKIDCMNMNIDFGPAEYMIADALWACDFSASTWNLHA